MLLQFFSLQTQKMKLKKYIFIVDMSCYELLVEQTFT
jgi:hypothetical protein